MRTVLLTAYLSLAAGWTTGAGSPQSAPPVPTTVTIDVTVVDRNGRSVPGLAAADFTVQLDGQAQRIVTTTYLPAGAPMAGGVGPMFDSVTAAPPVYRIVVEPPAGSSPGREFTIGVVVSRPGARVLSDARGVAAAVSTGVSRPAPAVESATSLPERLRNAIATGRQERGLAIRFGRTLRRDADPAQVLLDVQIEIGASAKPPLSTLLGVVDGRGAIRSAGQDIAAAGDGGAYRLDFSLPLAPGPYKLRFAAADAAGTIGAVESTVAAELATMGALRASDLLRWSVGGDTQPRPLMFDELPSGASRMGAMLELYGPSGADAMPDLLVKMTFGPAETGAPASIERIVTPEVREGALKAEAEFPLERFGSGTYLLRAVVHSGTTVLGSVSATVIKR